jgi:hypothetical protein
MAKLKKRKLVKPSKIKKSKPLRKSFSKPSQTQAHAIVLSPYSFGHALGSVSVFALLFYMAMVWFAGFPGSIIVQKFPLGFSFTNWTVILGLIETYAMGYVGGWIAAKIYNRSLGQ